MKTQGESKREQSQLDVYSPMQAYVISRLSQAIALNKIYLQSEDKDPYLTKVMQRGIYSYFRDCQDEGVEEEAKLLLNAIASDKAVLTPQAS